MTSVIVPVMPERDGALFSLSMGEGKGTMLGLAAGDTAGGVHPSGYAATTQQAVVVAYHLLRTGQLERDTLREGMLELSGDSRDPSVWRVPSEQLRRWYETAGEGEAELSAETGIDPASRVAPVGVWFRRDPEALVDASLETTRLTHLDAASALMAASVAGAVAAACFAQNGRDMLMAVADVTNRAAAKIENQSLRYSATEAVGDVVGRVRLAATSLDQPEAPDGSDPVGLVIAGLLLAAPAGADPEESVERAARIGSSPLAAIVGAILGARHGIRVWPWKFPNDTWFMAMGRGLVVGQPADMSDLPVPYAVEQRVTYASEDPI